MTDNKNDSKFQATYEKELKKQRTIEETLKKEAGDIRKEFTKRTLGLITSGFGIVAALAWNDVIKEMVDEFVKPYFGKGSGLLSLTIYAILITALVVFVSYNLSKITPEENKK